MEERRGWTQSIVRVEWYERWTPADELREHGEDQGFDRIAVGGLVLDEEDYGTTLADLIRDLLGDDVDEVWVHDDNGVRHFDRTDAEGAP